jgi:hypothetical protein
MSPRKLMTDPEILEMPDRKMAVLHDKGAPDKVFTRVFPALYGSVYTLKFALKKEGKETFKVEAPRARYPDVNSASKDNWTIVTAIPVPDNVAILPQKIAGIEVKLETWEYGTVGQIMHIGAYDQEKQNIEKLQKYIAEQGYEIAGPHEEEYCTRPDAKVMKTIIRYRVKKKV